MTEVAWIVGLAIIGVVSMLDAKRDARPVAWMLAKLAGRFGCELTSSSSMTGHRNGVSITLRFGMRGKGSERCRWTEIRTRLPAGYPLEIHMHRRHSSDRASDVLFDPAFDVAYLVEAAPRDVVRHMVDEPMRVVLMSHRAELTTIDDGHGGRLLQLAVPEWVDRELPLAELVDELVRVTQRVRLAYATDERIQPIAGSPYRAQAEGSRQLALEAAREMEISNLVELRSTRATRERLVRRLILAGFMSWGVFVAVCHYVL